MSGKIQTWRFRRERLARLGGLFRHDRERQKSREGAGIAFMCAFSPLFAGCNALNRLDNPFYCGKVAMNVGSSAPFALLSLVSSIIGRVRGTNDARW
jgi:hypothetical protein